MRRLFGAALLAVVLTGCGATANSEPRTSSPTWDRDRFLKAHPPTGTPTAEPAKFTKRVGALFSHDTKGDHFCTASAVDSPSRNMLVTAAHCIHDGKGGSYRSDLVFVPGYKNGSTPYGVWKVRSLIVDTRWSGGSDPDMDVGFVTLEPLDGKNITDVLGANLLGINEGFENVVRVTGYPSNADASITCVNKSTKQDTYQMRFACGGYFPGTSGSPWITNYDQKTGTGDVVGVIGGYEAGGDVDQVSYSPYFDDDVRKLYESAISASTPSPETPDSA